MNPGRKKIV
jgi:hypothetical protein